MATIKRKPILVAVDGSESATRALATAIELAQSLETEVVAAYVIPTPGAFEYGDAMTLPVELDLSWRTGMKEAFEEEWCKPLRDSGLKYRLIVEDGRPASVIAGLAESVDAQMVVVGRRGRGGIAELLLGSVSHELALQSKRPLLLVSNPKAV